MVIRVECYSGHRGEEAPRAFYLDERRAEVIQTLDRWLSPSHRYFKVQTYDGGTCVLRHDEVSSEWEMMLFSKLG